MWLKMKNEQLFFRKTNIQTYIKEPNRKNEIAFVVMPYLAVYCLISCCLL